MGILGHLLASILHLLVVGLDLVAFFVVVHVLATVWPRKALLAFHRVGAPLIDPLFRGFMRLAQPILPVDHRGRVARFAIVFLLATAVCRSIVSAIAATALGAA